MMIFIQDVWLFLNSNKGGAAVVGTIAAAAWQCWKYIKEWNFNNYHKLIKELSQSDTPGEHVKLDRQVAVVYELRNYPRYFSVSKRILQGWLDSKGNQNNEYSRLYCEMRISIEYMQKCAIYRILNKIFMENNNKITTFDGDYEIIYSSSFNIYENELNIKNILSYDFKFIFEKENPNDGQSDISISNEDSKIVVSLSKKARSVLGGGTTKKSSVIKFQNGSILYYSLYAKSYSENTDALNVVVSFYLK